MAAKREADGMKFQKESRRRLHDMPLSRPSLFSCHNRKSIDSVNTIKPQRKVGVDYPFTTCKQHSQYLERNIYTCINERDVSSAIKRYLYLWKHLRGRNAYKICNFIISQTFQIHQDHANLFLNLYCPKMLKK